MRKKIFWIILILLPIAGIAQQQNANLFYYYKGIKQNIGINTQKALFLSKNETPAALSITNILKNRYGMDSITSVDANYQEVHFNNSSPTALSYLEKISTLNDSLTDFKIEPYLVMHEDDQVRLSGYFYVKLKQLSDTIFLQQKATEYNAKIAWQNKYMPLWFVLENQELSVQNRLNLVNAFYECDLFQAVEPDLVPSDAALSSCASDSLFGEQWNLHNTGQYGGVAGIDIKACHAWELSKGRNTIVAIVDCGINYTHSDLLENLYPIAYNADRDIIEFTIAGSHGTEVGGIEVLGNENLRQEEQYQGVVILKNGARIENAICGIYVGERGSSEKGGGIVYAQNTAFINNKQAVCFAPYLGEINQTSIPPNNKSYFTHCEFLLDNASKNSHL